MELWDDTVFQEYVRVAHSRVELLSLHFWDDTFVVTYWGVGWGGVALLSRNGNLGDTFIVALFGL